MTSPPIVVGDLPPGPVTPGIRASIESALAATIPADKHGVVLQVSGAHGQGVTFAGAVRINDRWTLQGDLSAWGKQGVEGRIQTAYVW